MLHYVDIILKLCWSCVDEFWICTIYMFTFYHYPNFIYTKYYTLIIIVLLALEYSSNGFVQLINFMYILAQGYNRRFLILYISVNY